jgi:hypothetical protein
VRRCRRPRRVVSIATARPFLVGKQERGRQRIAAKADIAECQHGAERSRRRVARPVCDTPPVRRRRQLSATPVVADGGSPGGRVCPSNGVSSGFSFQLFTAVGIRSVKVIAKALSASFQRMSIVSVLCP